jgi:hypothetical protein
VFSALCARKYHDQYATVHSTSIVIILIIIISRSTCHFTHNRTRHWRHCSSAEVADDDAPQDSDGDGDVVIDVIVIVVIIVVVVLVLVLGVVSCVACGAAPRQSSSQE